jgi:hypothetical protein
MARKNRPRSNGNPTNGWLDAIAVRALENNLHERYITIIDEMVKDDPEFQKQLAEHTATILEHLLRNLRKRYPAHPNQR